MGSTKLIGITITNNLFGDVIKKASKRLYFLVRLRAGVPREDLAVSGRSKIMLCGACTTLLSP